MGLSDDLKQLAYMWADGELTDEEYAQAKTRLLAGGNPTPPATVATIPRGRRDMRRGNGQALAPRVSGLGPGRGNGRQMSLGTVRPRLRLLGTNGRNSMESSESSQLPSLLRTSLS